MNTGIMNAKIKEWIFTVLAFIVFFYLYAVFSYFGIKDFIREGPLRDYFASNVWHLEILLAGILLGTLFMLINRWTERPNFRKRSFGFNILLKSSLYVVSLLAVCLLLYKLFLLFGLIDDDMLSEFGSFVSINLISSFFIYWGLFVLLTNFMLSVSKKFGPKTLVDLLVGKYYHPRSEELIFLFLDLRDSTRLAEKLGHDQYSRMIKKCVHELTPIIQKYHARVYQYVGDEVILFWEMKQELIDLGCLDVFFDFQNTLEKLEKFFFAKYGEIPSYKAGMDAGVVTLTEIGDIKREIAFHGDVLNTASRLEKKCNEFGEKFIVSQHVIDRVDADDKYCFRLLSDLPLRGKSESLKFYAVNVS